MKKKELIDKAIHENNGIWPMIRPDTEYAGLYDDGVSVLSINSASKKHYTGWNVYKYQFEQRAKELGYVNGYRWGVEYPADGKKPNLADNVIIEYWTSEYSNDAKVISLAWSHDSDACHPVIKFRIVDKRYKPADTSYLETPALEPVPQEENWYDYDNQKAIGLPPVNELVEAAMPHTNGRGEQSVIWIEGLVIAHHKIKENVYSWFVEPDNGFYPPNVLQFRPLDWNRKAEAEKKRVVDAAMKIASGGMTKEMYEALYDAGYLKTPDQTITESNAVLAARIAQLTLVNSELNQKISDLESKLWNQTNPTSLD